MATKQKPRMAPAKKTPQIPLSMAKFIEQFQKVSNSASLLILDKASKGKGGQVTLEDITDALKEFSRLFKAGIASNAEKLTLFRAFPTNLKYAQAASKIPEDTIMVVGGPASVSLIDREGHLITPEALGSAFEKYMANFRTRNAMVLHSDVQVGWALPAYITRGGQIYRSGVNGNSLFFICEIRDDTRIADKVREQIKDGKLKSYSIAGSAVKVKNMQKGLMPYMQVDEMELAEVTVCEKGVNQGAGFEILKAEQTGKVSQEDAHYRETTAIEQALNITCGSCIHFNEQKESCDLVTGIIYEEDYCDLYEPEEDSPDTMETEEQDDTSEVKIIVELMSKEDGDIDFIKSFFNYFKKEHKSDRRAKKRFNERYGHKQSGGSVKKIQQIIGRKSKDNKTRTEDINNVHNFIEFMEPEWDSSKVQKQVSVTNEHPIFEWGEYGLVRQGGK